MEKDKDWLSQRERARYIQQMIEWTQKTPNPNKPMSGCFPLDHGTNFDAMSNGELIKWHDAYTWALDEKNFNRLNTKKGG